MFDKIWKVWVAGEKASTDAEDIVFEFVDSTDVLGSSRKVTIRQELLDDLVSNVKKYDNYNAIKALRKIQDPEESIRNESAFVSIFCITKDDIRMGFLLELTDEGVLILTGFWPNSLASAISEKIDLLDNIFSSLAQNPTYWKRVDVLLSDIT